MVKSSSAPVVVKPAPGPPGPDPAPDAAAPPTGADVNAWLALLFGDGQAVEVRAPQFHDGRRTVNVVSRFGPGQTAAAAREALRLSGGAPGVYVVMNGVDPDLPLGQRVGKGATAADVPGRRWLLVDCDPVRPGTVNATDAEKAAALALAETVHAALADRGWPEPLWADSGNGYHLLYRVDLPPDGASTELVKRGLIALAERFDVEAAKVDRKVFDLPRLVKCYGTRVCKGEDAPDRPARYSRLLTAPDAAKPAVVPRALLEALATEAEAPTPAPARPAPAAGFDLAAEVDRKRGRDARESSPRTGTGTATKDATATAAAIEARAVAYLAKCEPAISGDKGHDRTFKVAVAVGPGFDLPPETAFRLLWTHYNPHCEPPWSERELRHKVKDAYEKGPRRGWLLEAKRPRRAAGVGTNGNGDGRASGPPNGDGRGGAPTLDDELSRFHLTDLGNAERLVARHGHDLRYCHPWKAWLVWDGRRWKADDTASVRRLARETVRRILAEAAAESDDGRRKELVKWAMASEKRDRVGAMLHLAEAEAGIPILPAEMDTDPWLFNCLNGTIDLRTGKLRTHRRQDVITKLCPVDYDPDAHCPYWLATLAKFFARSAANQHAELIDYWQRVCGYAMAGVIRDHVMPVAYGVGANGKSTIIGALLDVFGFDYAMKSSPDMFMAKKTDSHPTDRADLFGKRLVVAIETEAGRRLNETMVKELTGGDRIRARRMREDFWEFSPTHTLIMATNHKPVIRGTDNGIWRRLRLVPFTVSVSDAEADKGMPAKLRAEAAGILSWCVRGCLEWQRRGLDAPDEIKRATGEYRAQQDVLGGFLEAHTTRGHDFKVRAGALYDRYRQWAESSGEHVLSLTRFGEALRERGIESQRSGGVWYVGIGLTATEPDPARENRSF